MERRSLRHPVSAESWIRPMLFVPLVGFKPASIQPHEGCIPTAHLPKRVRTSTQRECEQDLTLTQEPVVSYSCVLGTSEIAGCIIRQQIVVTPIAAWHDE